MQHRQIGNARLYSQAVAEAHALEIDQEDLRLVISISDHQVAEMQISMEHSRVMGQTHGSPRFLDHSSPQTAVGSGLSVKIGPQRYRAAQFFGHQKAFAAGSENFALAYSHRPWHGDSTALRRT